VVGIALNCYDVDDRAARDFGRRIEAETGLPTVDPVKFGADALLEPLLAIRKTPGAHAGGNAVTGDDDVPCSVGRVAGGRA
jgi:hypothetical protein